MVTKEFTKADWDQLLLDQILKCNDIESAILKGHILLEYLLNHFIDKANPKVKIEMRAITFSTKATIRWKKAKIENNVSYKFLVFTK